MAVVDELIAVLGFDLEGEANARKFNSTLDRLDGKVKKFAGGVVKYGGLLATALGAGAAAFGKSVIDTSAQFETFQATLETIEGSADKARASLDWIAEFGKTTPYEVAGVTDAFVKLKAYGIDPIANDTLRILGDTASAMNKPLMQAVEAFADASTMEFERLKEFGIKAKQAGEEVTFSWTKDGQELTRTVKKNGEEVRKFLLENMGDRFNGAMERQSKTWKGMMSNLSDSWTAFQRKIGEKGFFDTVQGYLGGLLDKVNQLDADGTLDRWAENLSAAFTNGAEGVGFLIARIAGHVGFLSENMVELEGPIYAVAAAFAILLARAYPVLAVVTGLVLAIDDLLVYAEGGEGSKFGLLVQQIQDLTGASEGLSEALAGGAAGLGALIAGGLILKPLKTLGILKGAILGMVTGLAGKVLAVVGVVAAALFSLIGLARYDLPEAWQASLAPLFNLEDRINEIFLGLDFFQSGQAWMDSLWQGLDSGIAKVAELPKRIEEYLLSTNFFQAGQRMMDSLFAGMKSVGESIKGWFQSLIPSWALKFVGGEVALPSAAAAGISNFQANNARADSGMAAEVNNVHDERNQSQTNNVTVNQTVTQVADAPAAAARATGNAVGAAAASQRTQIEGEPGMP